jgi:phage-related protein
MVTSLRYVGPVAHSAGVDLDSVSEALAILGDRGIRGSTAGTSLRGVFVGLISPSEKAKGVLKDLGIITQNGANIMFDASGKMKSLADVAQILQDHTRGLSQEQKLAAFSTIFQRRAMASALVLSEQGAKGFAHYREEIKSQGSAADIAATRLNNLKGDVSLLKSAFETAVIKAGTPFQNMLRKIVQGVTDLVKGFAHLSPAMQSAILYTLLIGGALLTTLGAVALMLSAVFKMYRVFRDAVTAVKTLSAAFEALTGTELAALGPIALIIVAIVALIAAVILIWVNWDKIWNFIAHHKALALVLALIFPFIAILIAIVGAVKYVYENWSTIWPQIQEIFSKVVDGIITAWQAVSDFFVAAWSAIVGAFQSAWEAIQPILQSIAEIFDTIVGYVSDFASAVGDQLSKAGKYFDKNIMPTVRSFGDLFVAIFQRCQDAVDIAWSVIQPILTLLGIAFQTAFQQAQFAIQLVIEIIQHFIDFAIPTFQLFMGFLGAAWAVFWPIISGVVEVTLAIISAIIRVFVATVQAIWTPFWNIIKGVIVNVWSFIKEYVDAAMQFVKGIIDIITGLISGDWSKVWQGIKNIFAGIWDGIVAIARFMIENFRLIIVNGITAVVNFVKSVPGLILTAVGNVAKLLFQKGADIITGLGNGIYQFWNAIYNWLSELPGLILGTIGDLGRTLFNAGKALIGGLLDGIKAAVGGVKDFLGGLASKFVSWKGPPPKDAVLLKDNGALIMSGLVDGIASGLPALKSMLGQVTGTIQGINPAVTASLSTTGAAVLGAGAGLSSDTYTFNFTFGDLTSGETASEVKNAVTSAEVLDALTMSIRAGKRT